MENLKNITKDCQEAVKFYEDNPGLAGTGTMIDLYRTIARLAECIRFERARNPMLPENIKSK